MASIQKLPPRERNLLIKTDSPFLDMTDGLIKGGGRLSSSDLTFNRKHPILIPDTELGDALIGQIHHSTGHQGRKVNAAIIRENGYSVLGGRKRIQKIISACVYCRTLRMNPMEQKMADLPEHRLWRTPLFCIAESTYSDTS